VVAWGGCSIERCGMLEEALMNLFSLCWSGGNYHNRRGGNTFSNNGSSSHSSSTSNGNINGGVFGRDGLLWYHDIGKYGSGEFSMAVVQANQVLEDQCQIESGRFGTFVGVYDGHGGPDAARYACDHLFRHFQGSFLLLNSFYPFLFDA
jgi:pyruvate dehydrogenase phosphatase